MAFDIKAALEAIRAHPELSGYGGPYMQGSGIDGMMYDSVPFSAMGSYFNGGKALTPLKDEPGMYAVYNPSEPGHASRLNGTMADKYDSNGNLVGQYELKGISDKTPGKEFLIGGAMMAAPFALTAMGAGAGTGLTGGGFVGEGALSGIGAWDGALASAPSWSAGAAGAAGLTSLEGVPPPANPFSGLPLEGVPPPANPFSGGNPLTNLLPSGVSSLIGPAATAIGALAGSKGVNNEQTQQSKMDPRMDPLVYGDLFPRAQGLLNAQMPQAQQAGQQMMQTGSSLLGAPIAGNGYGRVQLNAPNTPTNPYLSGMADDISRRTQELLGQNNLAIQSRQVGAGGVGSTRQGVAQGVAAGKAADYLQGNLSGLYGNAYNSDQNRALQQYQADQGFYQGQRGQDLSQAIAGGGLLSQGLQTQWQPTQSASDIYKPYSGLNSSITTGSQQGGGWLGALGGAIGAAQLGKNAGWWGN